MLRMLYACAVCACALCVCILCVYDAFSLFHSLSLSLTSPTDSRQLAPYLGASLVVFVLPPSEFGLVSGVCCSPRSDTPPLLSDDTGESS